LTDTYQYFHHLQSFALGFRGGVLQDPVLQRFWNGTAEEPTKWDVISRNELALSKLLAREGYVTRSAFRSTDFVQPGQNPVILGWRRMLVAGFPFVKRELVRTPEVAPDAGQIPKFLENLYGIKLDEWL
jgi:lipopolysaccharide biosynthesis protein